MCKSYKVNFVSSSQPSKFFLKNFLKKIDLNSVFHDINTFTDSSKNYPKPLLHSHDVEIKSCLYKFLKILKSVKLKNINNSSKDSVLLTQNFGSKLQSSFIFSSFIEQKKKEKYKKLKAKIRSYDDQRVVKNFSSLSLVCNSKFIENSWNFNPHGYSQAFEAFSETFENQGNDNPLTTKEKLKFLHYLKNRRLLNCLAEFRLYPFVLKNKKKYRKLFVFFKRQERKMRHLFTFHNLSRKNYRRLDRQTSRHFKKMVWKRKRRLKIKKLRLLRFIGSRRRLPLYYFTPNHFEINYKTLNSIYLGYVDTKSVNAQIPFWLNLRKLSTFLSS
jgi:hypothetical protein